jgi:hypothetical protein
LATYTLLLTTKLEVTDGATDWRMVCDQVRQGHR